MKKNLYILITIVLLVNKTYSQTNLVPNPSFEVFSTCPDDWAQINYVSNWQAYKGSPDYYNACGAVDSFSVPKNFIGLQNPSSGDAYCGLILYDKNNFGNDEMIGATLIQPLQTNTKYFFSLKVVLKYNNPYSICCSQNKIGAMFSTVPYNISNPPPQNNFAHVYTNSVISDTTNWTQIFGSFIADSAYTNISIGTFFSNANLSVNNIQPTLDYSYYFIDDICVSTDSLYSINYIYTGIQNYYKDNNLFIYPNPTKDFFKVKTNDNGGSFIVKINNVLGQELYSNLCNSNTQIDVSNYNDPLLIVSIINKNKLFTYKLIKP